MTATETFQLQITAAEFYEQKFVPAIFAEWAPLLIQAAGISPGQSVLDVGCGTGIVARHAANRLAGTGVVVGVDLNDAMLAVARRIRPDIDWRKGDAGALPFPAREFDAVLCQMALMFFPDRVGALREMARVARDGGTVAAVVPGRLADQPAYGPFMDVAARHAGDQALALLNTYWSCGDIGELQWLFHAAGLDVVSASSHMGTARHASVEAFVRTEVEGSPLIDRITPRQYASIREDAEEVLRPFTSADGSVAAPLQGHIITATKK
ncbi:class I SAM-dependent methyltransferase [Arthrobacter globiformis]|uniref:class I SAM-dependent methyltransferase n=1 Tax=Arthrobacter globiformis TaxID=1665 RepID=UPI0027909002|nr:methyltransferase domain-containing protein [Arthrobacter globiformis]MDQ0617386.1 ubiquinone/menaquinone biosynthesis C-methylase UbiE [Arthrobacter globiformis]